MRLTSIESLLWVTIALLHLSMKDSQTGLQAKQKQRTGPGQRPALDSQLTQLEELPVAPACGRRAGEVRVAKLQRHKVDSAAWGGRPLGEWPCKAPAEQAGGICCIQQPAMMPPQPRSKGTLPSSPRGKQLTAVITGRKAQGGRAHQ